MKIPVAIRLELVEEAVVQSTVAALPELDAAGVTAYPPQLSGRGTSRPTKRRLSEAKRIIMYSREGMG